MHSSIPPKTRALKTPTNHPILKVAPKLNLQPLYLPNLLGSSGLHLLDFHFLDELLHQPIKHYCHIIVFTKKSTTNILPLQQGFLRESEAITSSVVVDY